MAQSKLSPRQKMINMMYLVLIALLVLNVDKRILKSFHFMEKSILNSSSNLDEKNDFLMSGFYGQLKNDSLKTWPYLQKAKQARTIAQEFNEYITQLKSQVEDLYGGRLEQEEGEEGLKALQRPEQMEKHAHFFMVDNNGKKAKELQDKINNTRDALLALLKPGADSLFVSNKAYKAVMKSNQLNADDPMSAGVSGKTWASINLEYQPAGALMAILSQYQFNAKSLESDVLANLAEAIHDFDFTFNTLKAEIIPNKNYVMEGENFEADILLVASNSTSNPNIIVNGGRLNTVENGVGKLSIPASGIGTKTVEGMIFMTNPGTAKIDSFKFSETYQVFKPVATVAPDQMNLFYVGLDNPVSISVPGFSASDLSVSASSGARLTGSNGRYNIRVDGSQRLVNVNVAVDGKSMGTTQFRVRNLPPPIPAIGSIRDFDRPVRAQVVGAQSALLASMGDDFAYNMSWRVTKFTIMYLEKNRPPIIKHVTGSTIPADVRRKISAGGKGDMVIIEGLEAVDTQYGNTKKLDPKVLRLQ